jgi:hypothetical protein
LFGPFVVVPRSSADPGVTDCLPARIDANHIDMCKYPHAMQIERAVRDAIEAACRGQEFSVFGGRLEDWLKKDAELLTAFNVLFKNLPGDRGAAESRWRRLLRADFMPHLKRLGDPALQLDLDLANDSRIAEDVWVWTMWYEDAVLTILRRLRQRAAAELQRDFRPSADADPTLIPLYRSLRTIEHISVGDTAVPGTSNRTDAQELLELLRDAQAKFESLRKTVASLDEGGETRQLLERLSSTVALQVRPGPIVRPPASA